MLRAARLLAAAAFLVLCLVSVVRTVAPAAVHWHAERIRFERARPLQARLYPALISLPTVDPFVFEAMRTALRPRDRYAFQMGLRPDQPAGSWIELFARYYLLPHVMVARPEDADVVLSFHASPSTLAVHVTDVRHVAHDLIVSRVQHGP
jgi:hypothetical protein